MKNKFYLTLGIFLLFSLNFVFVTAHGEDTFAEAEEIIKQKISCDNITDEQLEILGDYYMEQMHPGELHEIMDERMGGEGSENLRQVHINIGLTFYCGEQNEFSSGMMNTMMGRTGYGMYEMMYGGRIGNYYKTNYFAIFFDILLIIGIVLLIIWLWNQIQNPKQRR